MSQAIPSKAIQHTTKMSAAILATLKSLEEEISRLREQVIALTEGDAAPHSESEGEGVKKRVKKVKKAKKVEVDTDSHASDSEPEKKKRAPTVWAMWVHHVQETHTSELAEFKAAAEQKRGASILFAKAWRDAHEEEYTAFETAHKPAALTEEEKEAKKEAARIDKLEKKVAKKAAKKASKKAIKND